MLIVIFRDFILNNFFLKKLNNLHILVYLIFGFSFCFNILKSEERRGKDITFEWRRKENKAQII